MLIISLESWLLSLLTELPNRLPSAELFETNLLFGVTLPFYFPNDVTYGIGVANKHHSSHYPPLFNSTSSPATNTEDDQNENKVGIQMRKCTNEVRVESQGIGVGKTRALELHLYFHASFTPYFFWDWGKLVDLSVFQFCHLWNGNNIIVST